MQTMLVEQALRHMQNWVVTVKTLLKGEFPEYELLQCYSVFKVAFFVGRAAAPSLSKNLAKSKISKLMGALSCQS